MSILVYSNSGVLLEQWDDITRTYTDFRPTPDLVRAYTAEENARADIEAAAVLIGANATDIVAKARNALAGNASYLALASPTNAQVAAQVKALTRQNNALIKLEINDLATVDGT